MVVVVMVTSTTRIIISNIGVLEELFGDGSYTLAKNNHPAWYETEEYARKLNKLRW